jgi:hypothetical protein
MKIKGFIDEAVRFMGYYRVVRSTYKSANKAIRSLKKASDQTKKINKTLRIFNGP